MSRCRRCLRLWSFLLNLTCLWLLNFRLLSDGLIGVGRNLISLRRVDHSHQFLRVLIDPQGNLLVLKVVDGVEMPQEELPEDEVLIVEFVQFVLGDRELALAFRLEEVLRGVDLEDCLTTS